MYNIIDNDLWKQSGFSQSSSRSLSSFEQCYKVCAKLKQTKNPKMSCKEKLSVDHILFNCQLMKSLCFLDGHLLGIYMYLYKMFSWKIIDQIFLGLSPDNPIVSLFEYMPFRVYGCVNVCACMWSCAHEL